MSIFSLIKLTGMALYLCIETCYQYLALFFMQLNYVVWEYDNDTASYRTSALFLQDYIYRYMQIRLRYD